MAAPSPKASIGSFVFEAPYPLNDPGLARFNAADVTNPADESHAIAFRVSLAQFNALDVTQLRERLERRAAIQTAGVLRVLEAGIAGTSAFTVEAPPSTTRLADQLSQGLEFTPFQVVTLVHQLQLSLVRARMSHGQISSDLIWIDESGRPVLGGFAFVEPEARADARGLAGLAFLLIANRRFDPNEFIFPAGVRAERVREALPGVTAQFAAVIAAGTNGEFATAGEFAAALENATIDSAADLAMAAHQSIAVKDPYGANLFLELGKRYQPDHPELTAVALRLAPGSLRADPAPTRAQVSFLDAPFVEPTAEIAYDPSSEQARFLASLKASIPEVTSKKPKFPWAAIVAGMFGMFGIVSVLAFIVVQSR